MDERERGGNDEGVESVVVSLVRNRLTLESFVSAFAINSRSYSKSSSVSNSVSFCSKYHWINSSRSTPEPVSRSTSDKWSTQIFMISMYRLSSNQPSSFCGVGDIQVILIFLLGSESSVAPFPLV
jgi:hypothetical protein